MHWGSGVTSGFVMVNASGSSWYLFAGQARIIVESTGKQGFLQWKLSW